jgi:ketosteroid isomerase-like protein
MSQESTTPDLVEVVRGMIESVRRRDLDGAVNFFAPDAVWDGWGVGDTFEGRAAIRGFFEDWLGTFEEFEAEPEEILDLGNGVVFAVLRQDARLVGSMGDVRLREVWAYTFVCVGGLIARGTSSTDLDEARAYAERLAQERG